VPPGFGKVLRPPAVRRTRLKKFFNPVSNEILGQCLDVLPKFLPSRMLDEEAWMKVEAQCLRSNASQFDPQVNLARALTGVNEATAHSSIKASPHWWKTTRTRPNAANSGARRAALYVSPP
jgi:hypothetical protein